MNLFILTVLVNNKPAERVALEAKSDYHFVDMIYEMMETSPYNFNYLNDSIVDFIAINKLHDFTNYDHELTKKNLIYSMLFNNVAIYFDRFNEDIKNKVEVFIQQNQASKFHYYLIHLDIDVESGFDIKYFQPLV